MSFDESNDADFIQDMQSFNIDDISIDTEHQINNSQEDKPDKTATTTQNTNQAVPTENETNTKPKKHNKRRPQAQNTTKKKPILDLSAFDFGAIDDNKNKSSIQASDHNILPEIEISNISSSALETRVTNYLDKSLSSLKTDVLNEIEFIFSRKDSITNIVDSFLSNISSEIRNEIHYLRSISISDQPMNISIEIDLPKSKPTFYTPISIDPYVNQISNLKTQYSQNLVNIRNEISDAIKSRDLEISKILHEKKQLSTKLHILQDKSFSLTSTYDDLEHTMKLISKQNYDLDEKIKELEDNSYIDSMTKDSLNELKSSIDDLSSFIEETKQNTKSRLLYQKILALKNETNDISSIANDTSIQISIFLNSWKKTDFQFRYLSQQNRNENFLRYSAPPYLSHTKQPSLFTSIPKTLTNSDYSLSHRISSNKPQDYSPIHIRKTPNFHVDNDEEEEELIQVNNYLLNKKFSPLMTDY